MCIDIKETLEIKKSEINISLSFKEKLRHIQ